MSPLAPILAIGLFIFVDLFAQMPTPASEMSRFTDTGFGFSVWYPTAWKVIDEPVADPTQAGWFPDATIVKELQFRNPAAGDDDQPQGVTLQELLAPEGLTELGQSKSASPVGVDGRYFFDTGTREWMYAQLSEAPDGAPPATHPAEILHWTMGGLPTFEGAARHGAELIVPLDGAHFLAISTMDVGGDDSHVYLAATVVGTHLDVGQRASEQVQAETIRKEGVKLGAIGESLGFWYKDSQHVYNFKGEVLPGADPKTFAPLSRDFPGDRFATDGVRVYRAYSGAIQGADRKTFVVTGESTARDAQHIYDWSRGSLKIKSVNAPK